MNEAMAQGSVFAASDSELARERTPAAPEALQRASEKA
ncbi:MAG: hypothetical protein JWL83_1492 [Actinomycetia bacterium]|nr:hypothetical protein [Actinomycetes bacterium]